MSLAVVGAAVHGGHVGPSPGLSQRPYRVRSIQLGRGNESENESGHGGGVGNGRGVVAAAAAESFGAEAPSGGGRLGILPR